VTEKTSLPRPQRSVGGEVGKPVGRVADPHHFIADPDTAFHFDADQGTAFHFNVNPDTAPQLSDGNLLPLFYRAPF